MKKIIITCLMSLFLFLSVCLGFNSNASELYGGFTDFDGVSRGIDYVDFFYDYSNLGMGSYLTPTSSSPIPVEFQEFDGDSVVGVSVPFYIVASSSDQSAFTLNMPENVHTTMPDNDVIKHSRFVYGTMYMSLSYLFLGSGSMFKDAIDYIEFEFEYDITYQYYITSFSGNGSILIPLEDGSNLLSIFFRFKDSVVSSLDGLYFSIDFSFVNMYDNYGPGYYDGLLSSVAGPLYNELKKGFYQDGYNQGKTDGYTEGYDTGYSDGLNQGKIDGYTDGYDDGYGFGYDDGYEKGFSVFNWVSNSFSNSVVNFAFSESDVNNPFVLSTSLSYTLGVVNNEYLNLSDMNDFLQLHVLENERNCYPIISLKVPINANDFSITFLKNNSFVQQDIYFLYADNSYDFFRFETTDTYTINLNKNKSIVKIAFRDLLPDYLINGAYVGSSSYNYQNGYDIGYENGRVDGSLTGYTNGYNSGYTKGYGEGYTEGSGSDNTLVGMMFAIIDAPFQILKESMNFNFLGVNIADFILSLITLLIVLKIFKVFF